MSEQVRSMPNPPRGIPYRPWWLRFASWFCYGLATIWFILALVVVWSDWRHALWDDAMTAATFFYVGRIHSWLYGWESWSRSLRAAVLSGRA